MTTRRIGCLRPSAIRISGRTITSNTTSALTGLDGSRKVGTSSRPSWPKPCTEPGCIATRSTSRSPRSASASRTCSEAPPPTAPAMTTISDRISCPSTTSRSRRGIGADDADPVHVGAGVAGGGGQRVGVDVVDLAGTRGAVDVDELAADRDHRQPGPGVHQHLVAAHRGEQPDLRGADDGARAHRDVAGLHVVADAAHEVAGTDRLVDLDAGAAAVGAVERQDRVGEGRAAARRCRPARPGAAAAGSAAANRP